MASMTSMLSSSGNNYVWRDQSPTQAGIGSQSSGSIHATEDDELAALRKKSRDPMSHRIIEKRRRDRMNSCLADLSRLIPAAYIKKGRGRIEKTEIIEMAIKHMRHLHQHPCPSGVDCPLASDQKGSKAVSTSERSSVNPPTSPTAICGSAVKMEIKDERDIYDMTAENQKALLCQYRQGYRECMSETMHFLVESEGYFAGDSLCIRLMEHLQKYCDAFTSENTPPTVFSNGNPGTVPDDPVNLSAVRSDNSAFKSAVVAAATPRMTSSGASVDHLRQLRSPLSVRHMTSQPGRVAPSLTSPPLPLSAPLHGAVVPMTWASPAALRTPEPAQVNVGGALEHHANHGHHHHHQHQHHHHQHRLTGGFPEPLLAAEFAKSGGRVQTGVFGGFWSLPPVATAAAAVVTSTATATPSPAIKEERHTPVYLHVGEPPPTIAVTSTAVECPTATLAVVAAAASNSAVVAAAVAANRSNGHGHGIILQQPTQEGILADTVLHDSGGGSMSTGADAEGDVDIDADDDEDDDDVDDEDDDVGGSRNSNGNRMDESLHQAPLDLVVNSPPARETSSNDGSSSSASNENGSGSGASGSYGIWCNKRLKNSNNSSSGGSSIGSSPGGAAEAYKFKTSIKRRFTADMHHQYQHAGSGGGGGGGGGTGGGGASPHHHHHHHYYRDYSSPSLIQSQPGASLDNNGTSRMDTGDGRTGASHSDCSFSSSNDSRDPRSSGYSTGLASSATTSCDINNLRNANSGCGSSGSGEEMSHHQQQQQHQSQPVSAAASSTISLGRRHRTDTAATGAPGSPKDAGVPPVTGGSRRLSFKTPGGGSSSSSSSSSSSLMMDGVGVPVFALHPRGTYYIPMRVEWSLISHLLSAFTDATPVLHPISISVNFCGPCQTISRRCMSRQPASDPRSSSPSTISALMSSMSTTSYSSPEINKGGSAGGCGINSSSNQSSNSSSSRRRHGAVVSPTTVSTTPPPPSSLDVDSKFSDNGCTGGGGGGLCSGQGSAESTPPVSASTTPSPASSTTSSSGDGCAGSRSRMLHHQDSASDDRRHHQLSGGGP